MAVAPQPLVPDPGERGLASYDVTTVAGFVLPAWDGFLAVAGFLADDRALDRASRIDGWTARDVCIHLGSWEDAPTLDRLLAEARGGTVDTAFDQEGHNAAVLAAHGGASDAQVLVALHAARERAVDFFDSAEARALAVNPTRSVLGPLPLLGHVAAGAYELAVHALDLRTAGAPEPSPELLHAGLGALADVAGALAARQTLDITVAALTPTGGWAFGARGGDWTTVELGAEVPAGELGWPAIEAAAAVILDVSAGRVAASPLIVRRELRAHDVPELLRLGAMADQVPGLPGGAALSTAVRYLSGVGRLVRRLPGLGR